LHHRYIYKIVTWKFQSTTEATFSHHREVRWFFRLALDGNVMFAVAVLLGQDCGAMPNIFHAEFSCPWFPTACVSGLPAHKLLLVTITNVNLLIATLKLHSNGPPYSNTVIGTLAVDGWAVTFGTARRGLGGLWPCPVTSLLYQM